MQHIANYSDLVHRVPQSMLSFGYHTGDLIMDYGDGSNR